MKRILRLLRYVRPYSLHVLISVLLMAVYAVMAGFRVMLVRPIVDNVLSPTATTDKLLNFSVPVVHWQVHLAPHVPQRLQNAWAIVAIALVGSAVVKSLCDYFGTLLANKAGFGMVTDLRNSLYDAILRRSTAFFQRHTSGMLISTLINDVERVQNAMATVMVDFLQQLFTLLVMIGVVIHTGHKMAWILLLFLPVIIASARRIGRRVRHTTRRGQDKLAEIQNIVQETITGNPIVKAFGMEHWEMNRFRRAADRLLAANMRSVAVQALSFATNGCTWCRCDCFVATLWATPHRPWPLDHRHLHRVSRLSHPPL